MLLMSACSADFALRASDVPCATASECGPGFICRSSACVPNMAVGPDEVHIEVAPPPGTPFPRAQLLAPEVIGGVLGVRISAPAVYEVRVLDEGRPIGASVTFFGDPRIPDREVDVTQSISADDINPSVLRLVPGTFTVRVIPDDRSLPGFEAADFTARESVDRQTKDFEVPTAYRSLSGIVASSVSGSSTIAGVEVRAVGIRTGLPSTTAISDDSGRYELLLPDTGETEFRLTADPPASDGPSWSFEQIITVERDASREKPIELEGTRPELRGNVMLDIIGLGTGSGPEAVPNASVTLTATQADGLDTRVYRVFGVTDARGRVTATIGGASMTSLPILEGRYVVEVTTPVSSPYASTTALLDLSGVLSEQIPLGLKTRVTGSVTSAFGSPVRDASIELIELANGRVVESETESDGTYKADIDPGSYLIVVRPTRGGTGELLPVSATEAKVTDGARFDVAPIALPFGAEVSGAITGDGVGPIADARVEFFIRSADRTISIARTTTNRDGSYSVVLPDR
jgi:hypothetical protein